MSLTEAEHRAMNLTAELANIFAQEIVASGPTRDQDVDEFVLPLHAIQHMIMAQSAAREYPDLYRLAGGELTAVTTVCDSQWSGNALVPDAPLTPYPGRYDRMARLPGAGDFQCIDCSGLVIDREAHDRWHARVEPTDVPLLRVYRGRP